MKNPIKKIDWTELRGQKTVLLKLIEVINTTDPQPYKKNGVEMAVIMIPKDAADALDGIVNLIDALQDYAVDELGVPEMHVFDFEQEEEREQSTPFENFARDSAQSIFDELCESDGFHTDDEMPEKFIESVMADRYDSDIIKAKIRAQIINDLRENPEAFQYENGIPVYDSRMREDYEGIATQYIREKFDSGKTKTIWLCGNCGSDNVEGTALINPNDPAGNPELTAPEQPEGNYCFDCKKHVTLVKSTRPLRAEIVGYQVVDPDAGEMHPCMEASFCLYNLSQAREMLKGCQTMKFAGNWKLLAIWTGDVEEPTLMFKGNPRD